MRRPLVNRVFMLSQQSLEISPTILHPGWCQHQDHLAAKLHDLRHLMSCGRADAEIALVKIFSPAFDRQGTSHSHTHFCSVEL